MKLYGKFFMIHLKSQMQYKTSFILLVIGNMLTSFTAFLAVYFLFTQINQVEGFTFSEVLICFSTILMAFSVAECFARGFDQFPSMISNGEFDRTLVRPRNEIFLVLASKMDFKRVGRFIQSVIMLICAVITCGIIWSIDKIITLVLMILCGSIIFAGLFLVYASFTFFTVEGLEFMNILTDGGREFGKYPYSIYGEKLLKFFTFVVPLALVQYYPLLYLLDRTGNKLYMLLPLIGTLFIIPCYGFWRFGLRRYKSTGS